MANPSNYGADAAYDRAAAAFAEQSFDVARRWVLEALAQNPEHAGARALLARLDSVRRPPNPSVRAAGARATPFGPPGEMPGPEAVSTDPTVLISRADRTPPSEGIEPTVMIRRDPPRAAAPVPDPFRTPPRSTPQYDPRSAPEPTVIGIPAPPRPPAPPKPGARPASASPGGFMQRVRDLFGASRVAPAPAKARRAAGVTPGMRGAALVAGAIVVAALLLWAGYMAVRWMWPGGVELVFERPTGGTISGPGLECGSKGRNCSTTAPKGDTIQLDVQADPNFVFGGFTGDCPESGRLVMDKARKCGVLFNPVGVTSPTASVTFPLNVTKPQGGSLTAEGVILCGTLGNDCAANVPSGTPVRMGFQADDKYTFQAYTGDCAPSGELLMNSAKSCGAIFMPTPTGTVVNPDVTSPAIKVPPTRKKTDTVAPPRVAPPVETPAPPPIQPTPQPTPQQQPPPPAVTGPVKEAISAEDHAKQEIEALVKKYCGALETLKAENVRDLWPLAPMSSLREQFGVYRSLKCSISAKPEFQRLDARDIGGAQVVFDMKQVREMKKGGATKEQEYKVTMVVSRLSFQAPWRIDRINVEEKPK